MDWSAEEISLALAIVIPLAAIALLLTLGALLGRRVRRLRREGRITYRSRTTPDSNANFW
ncbi:hypothetical protein GCM10027515_11570 [Schumannella luteola]|uniref:Uncharacterized protein n=1 Tax=Schumannella luteola TaxID=472059 RepID=A0A852YK81_9MICO|nr:hypothetical protein [Schumannella luteola]NYG97605.1 hypothetical protein [Schumannella luteola]TPX04660.1 hypothetical protein FJ656_10465 [Schumannella luteola]